MSFSEVKPMLKFLKEAAKIGNVKTMRKIAHIFVAFSEKLNFNKVKLI